MKEVMAILTSTHIDKDGERLTRAGLEDLVSLLNQDIVPVGGHHDPRIPPQGRVLSAVVEQLEDGELAARGTIESFEDGDTPSLLPSRSVSSRRPAASLELTYDRWFAAPDINEELSSIAASVGIPCSQDLKKAIEGVLPVLVIAGIALGYKALESFTKGFFQELGADTWRFLANRLSVVLRKLRERPDPPPDTLLLVRVVTPETSPYVCVELVVPNATSDAFEQIAVDVAPALDSVVARLKEQYPEVVQFVFAYEDGKVLLLYAVRQDAVPLRPDSQANPRELTACIRDAIPVDVGMGISIAGRCTRLSARDD